MVLSHIILQELDFITFAFSLAHLRVCAHTHTRHWEVKKQHNLPLNSVYPFLYPIHLLNSRTLTACLPVPKFFLSGITEEGFFHIFACGSAAWLYNTAKHHSKFLWTVLYFKTFVMEKRTIKKQITVVK